MSLDGMKTEYHITPRGWVIGAQGIFGPIKDSKGKRPKDAVATYEECIHQEYEMAPETATWTEIWRKEGVSEAALDRLFKQYGRKASGWTLRR